MQGSSTQHRHSQGVGTRTGYYSEIWILQLQEHSTWINPSFPEEVDGLTFSSVHYSTGEFFSSPPTFQGNQSMSLIRFFTVAGDRWSSFAPAETSTNQTALKVPPSCLKLDIIGRPQQIFFSGEFDREVTGSTVRHSQWIVSIVNTGCE